MSDRRGDVERIFLEAAGAPAGERARLIQERCGTDEGLKAEVLSLLEHHEEGDSGFLDHAELELGEAVLAAGSRVAGFVIKSVIGSGGMGVVYLAEQERPKRTVALKVIRRGLGSAAVLRRFEIEAEVLGRLQHPGIAQVYEAGFYGEGTKAQRHEGTEGTRAPYIAMELVEGLPLGEYCDRARLDARRRMELVTQVCDAVQHAHQRGVIHRDLKPANILVDQGGRPKVLDFGVARVAGVGGRATLRTGVGQLIGTLAYMSPEQMLADPAEVDTRADVYALGVVLYQLLTGRLPLELDDRPLPEAARIIRDEEPARPGTVVRSLRGEVETLVMKALAKDRSRRYQSAADLAADLRRYLDGRPIAAKDDSALYVIGKQIRRHGVLVGSAGVLLAMLVAFAVYAQVQSKRNRRLAVGEERAKVEALESLKAAKAARAVADETSERLKVELVGSTVERGRLLGRAGNLSAAEELLWPVHLQDPGSRQTYWALWELYAHEPSLATHRAHEGQINGMAMGPGVVYTAAADGVVRVWDAARTSQTGAMEGHAGTVMDLAVNGDGSLLATVNGEGDVVLWDAATRRIVWRVRGHEGGARAVAFSADGALLATGGQDRAVRVWDVRSGRAEAALSEGFRGPVVRLAWRPRTGVLACATGPGDGRIVLWDRAGGTATELGMHRGGTNALAFTRDGMTLASGGSDREIKVWDVASRTQTETLRAPNGSVLTLTFTGDDRTLVSTGWWTVDLWDFAERRRARSLSVRAAVYACAVSPDGTLIAAGMGDGQVQFWDTTPGAGTLRLGGHSGRVAGALSPDGRLAATGDVEGVLRVWDARDGALLRTVRAHGARIKSLRFSPDGWLLATGAEDRLSRLWDLRTGREIGRVDRHYGMTDDSLRFSPDGRMLAVVRMDSSVSLLRVPGLEEARSLPVPGQELLSTRFTPDGSRLAVLSRDQTIRLWPVAGGEPTVVKSDVSSPWCAAFSPDGARMIVGDWAREIQVWDARAMRLKSRLRGHTGLVTSVEFLPGEPAVAASTGADGLVRLWDIDAGLTLATLDGFARWDALSLSVADRRLMATSATGEAVVWDLAYFDRHIAWNALTRIRGAEAPAMKAWAERALGPRPEPAATGAGPDDIRAWEP